MDKDLFLYSNAFDRENLQSRRFVIVFERVFNWSIEVFLTSDKWKKDDKCLIINATGRFHSLKRNEKETLLDAFSDCLSVCVFNDDESL